MGIPMQPPDPPEPNEDELNEATSICDACTAVIPIHEAQTGEPGSEYEGCTLCQDCFPTEGQAQ